MIGLGAPEGGEGEIEASMATGTLKMWNADRGFGFIKEDDSTGPDVFMHISALQGIDPDNLRLGERLSFDVERDTRSGKIKAANVRRPG